jgi:hypothetical protein
MIMLTDRARERLKSLVVTRLRRRRRSLRLAPGATGQFGLVSDVPRPGDRRVEHDGTIVLLLSAPLANGLEGWILDCVDAGDGTGPGLRLRPAGSGEAVVG